LVLGGIVKRQQPYIVAFALTFCALSAPRVAPVETTKHDFTIRFSSGDFAPTKNVATALMPGTNHFIVQFDHPLTDDEKAHLAESGLRLLQYIPNLSYFARLDDGSAVPDLEAFGVRWIGSLTLEQKLAAPLSTGEIPDWIRRGGDLIQVTVALHSDQDVAQWASGTAVSLGARILGSQNISNAAELILPSNRLIELAAMDEVTFVQPALPPQIEHNDGCRVAARVDSAQAAPYGLSGNGIVLAMWDGGRADDMHTDFGSRVIATDESALTTHATHVAGTIIGSGSQSSGTFKGMAPSATLLTHLWWNTSSEMATQYGTAIGSYGAEISNNSWGVGVSSPATEASCAATLGNYFIEDATIDNIVRGGAGAPITIVWSAGNMRSSGSQYCGSIGWSYNTIDPLASSKNVIAVGAVISNDNSMTTFSSWGPTDDGRIKPDICAPGCQIGGDNGVTSTKLTSGYTVFCGTSMAAPVVSGVIALMKQRLFQLWPSKDLLPSTIKGILINTAIDRGPVGPDFQYGYGVLNAVAAVRTVGVGTPSYVEAAMITGVTHDYAVMIPPGTAKLKVTLVWDDPGGTAISGNSLINDIDLKLIDPSAVTILPWVLTPGIPSAAAAPGIDRKNNVEVAEVNSPAGGIWHARVTGYNIPQGPQKYSLVVAPDSANNTGTARTVDTRSLGDITALPGALAPVRFWVRNLGGGPDSVRVRVTDSLSWLNSVLDTMVWLEPFDSASFIRSVTVPGNTPPGVASKAWCLANSRSDTLARDSSRAIITVRTLYQVATVVVAGDTAKSPDSVVLSAWVYNTGNVTNQIQVNIVNDSGWSVSPGMTDTLLTAGDSALTSVLLRIPAEVPHGSVSHTEFLAVGDSGSSAMSAASVLIVNLFPPPRLILPDSQIYSPNRAPAFIWSQTGTQYRLVVASDLELTASARDYAAIPDTTFVIPTADSLPDGIYYWGVRAFNGTDSSSFQRNPRLLVVDNLPPSDVTPNYPVAGQYPNQQHFSFGLAVGVLINPVVAPEFNIIDLASDSLFAGTVSTYRPVITDYLILPVEIPEGRWYWRTRRADSAGNSSPFSPVATFVLDTAAPPVPSIVRPADTAVVGGNPRVLFSWMASPAYPHESSPDYYRVRISSTIGFDSSLFDTLVHSDSLSIDRTVFTAGDTLFWQLQALDSAGWGSSTGAAHEFRALSYFCGDMDSSGSPDIADVTRLISFLFLGGLPLEPLGVGSVDCQEGIDISDLSFLIAYLYLDGPPPCCY
jgi:hypothetical protein